MFVQILGVITNKYFANKGFNVNYSNNNPIKTLTFKSHISKDTFEYGDKSPLDIKITPDMPIDKQVEIARKQLFCYKNQLNGLKGDELHATLVRLNEQAYFLNTLECYQKGMLTDKSGVSLFSLYLDKYRNSYFNHSTLEANAYCKEQVSSHIDILCEHKNAIEIRTHAEEYEILDKKLPDREGGFIKDNEGREIPTIITKKMGDNYEDIARVIQTKDGEVVGKCGYDIHKNFLYIRYLGTSEKYKGAGKELIKCAAMDCKDLGLNFIALEAMAGVLPNSYSYLAGNKMNKNPIPFYYKLGFRFKDKSKNEPAKIGIDVLNNTGIYPDGAPKSGEMFLSKENMEKLLNN